VTGITREEHKLENVVRLGKLETVQQTPQERNTGNEKQE
jgi:hypothetical protein